MTTHSNSSIPKPEAPCPQQEIPGKSVGLRSANQARWVTGNRVSTKLFQAWSGTLELPEACRPEAVSDTPISSTTVLTAAVVCPCTCYTGHDSCSHSSPLLWYLLVLYLIYWLHQFLLHWPLKEKLLRIPKWIQ
ncbi:unnamed protein product, partial [Coregonus sp. 'balchen']